jgi:hypothetical protein
MATAFQEQHKLGDPIPGSPTIIDTGACGSWARKGTSGTSNWNDYRGRAESYRLAIDTDSGTFGESLEARRGNMRPSLWQPSVELSTQEEQIMKRIRKAKLFVFLRQHRHELLDEAFQQELANLYRKAERGSLRWPLRCWLWR